MDDQVASLPLFTAMCALLPVLLRKSKLETLRKSVVFWQTRGSPKVSDVIAC